MIDDVSLFVKKYIIYYIFSADNLNVTLDLDWDWVLNKTITSQQELMIVILYLRS